MTVLRGVVYKMKSGGPIRTDILEELHKEVGIQINLSTGQPSSSYIPSLLLLPSHCCTRSSYQSHHPYSRPALTSRVKIANRSYNKCIILFLFYGTITHLIYLSDLYGASRCSSRYSFSHIIYIIIAYII